MRKMIMWQACICVMLMFMSMNSGPTNEEALGSLQIQKILKQERGGVFRGLHFNMPLEHVLFNEKEVTPIKESKKELAYRIGNSSSGTNERTQIYYDFDYKGLYYITVESIQKDRVSAIKFHRNMQQYFDRNFGANKISRSGNATWTTFDEASGLAYNIVCEQVGEKIYIKYYAV